MHKRTRLEYQKENVVGDFRIFDLKGEIFKISEKKQIFERNSASNYFSATKFHMKRLNLNTQKLLLVIMEFSIFRRRKGKISKFRRIQIFEHYSAPNYCSVKKIHLTRLDLNTKNQFLAIFEFSIRGKIA